jgi:hypothetical protein
VPRGELILKMNLEAWFKSAVLALALDRKTCAD